MKTLILNTDVCLFSSPLHKDFFIVGHKSGLFMLYIPKNVRPQNFVRDFEHRIINLHDCMHHCLVLSQTILLRTAILEFLERKRNNIKINNLILSHLVFPSVYCIYPKSKNKIHIIKVN